MVLNYEDLKKYFSNRKKNKSVAPLEQIEEVVFEERAKLWRYDVSNGLWKERGIGVFKILKNTKTYIYRVLMRRDSTLTLCSNHIITAEMNLEVHCGHNKTWMYTVLSDFSDDVQKTEVFAVRFLSVEVAQLFFQTFNTCREENKILFENRKKKTATESNIKQTTKTEGETSNNVATKVKHEHKENGSHDKNGNDAENTSNDNNKKGDNNNNNNNDDGDDENNNAYDNKDVENDKNVENKDNITSIKEIQNRFTRRFASMNLGLATKKKKKEVASDKDTIVIE